MVGHIRSDCPLASGVSSAKRCVLADRREALAEAKMKQQLLGLVHTLAATAFAVRQAGSSAAKIAVVERRARGDATLGGAAFAMQEGIARPRSRAPTRPDAPAHGPVTRV